VVAILAVPAAASSAEPRSDHPRRPDGRPDLSGTYDIATLTPVERPPEYGDQLTLSDEEASAIGAREMQMRAARNRPSDPDREAAPFLRDNDGTAFWIDLEVGPYDDPELRPLQERCVLSRSRSGPPALPALYNNLKRIVQTDDHVTILVEQIHDARIIRLDAEHGPPTMRKWMGDSVGRWEGDTLVVDFVRQHPARRPGAGAGRLGAARREGERQRR
jgi:hypothetical protein